jgi:hypothetical protein
MLLTALWLLQASTSPGRPDPEQFRHRNGRIPRTVTAVFVASAPRIDGHLDEPAWQLAAPQSGFRRDVPSDGNPAAEETEVRVLYDHEALYVGARLRDHHPELVSRRLSRRDSFDSFNDTFFILIDSYHDHQTEFIFGVTPAGEKRDASMGGDGDNYTIDTSWDPVWEVKTSRDSLGWVAEARIPFSQLRFPQTPEQVWGIQFRRDIVRAGEAVDWSWASKNEPGVTSKFGHLLGLKDLPAPRRLEFLPYVRTQARLTEGVDPKNPFDNGRVTALAGGIDAKYGLTSDLTLSASINPDFGQVEADPSVVNLTAFETYFEERRPLFVEGSNIFNFGSATTQQRFFYSRRIGRMPSIDVTGTAPFIDAPGATSILGAIKLSGKTRSGWSIGAIDALTDRETARLSSAAAGPVTTQPIEPLSNYSVLRIKRDLNGGASGYGFIGTGVNRDVNPVDFPTLRTSAYTGAVDFFHRWKQNSYAIRGWFGGSTIQGSTGSMTDAQLSSARYFQRPDQGYVHLDSTARSMRGYAGEATLAKESGDWAYSIGSHVTSPGFELNDAGFQTDADRLRFDGSVTRRWFAPTKLARQSTFGVSATETLNFGGVRTGGEELAMQGGVGLHNFTEIYGYLSYRFRAYDDRITRGGPLMQRPSGWLLHGGVSSDRRRAVSAGVFGTVTADRSGGTSSSLYTSLVLQTRSNLYLQITPQYDRAHATAFYVADYADPTAAATFGRRYVFADLTQHTLSVSLRANWYFTPTLTLQVYAQPFVATGAYQRYGALAAPRSYDFSAYGANGSTIAFDPVADSYTIDADGSQAAAPAYTFLKPDFRIRSLKSNVVLRWEYLPGSTLFVVWNQNRYNSITDPRFRALRDLGSIFSDDMQNVFLLKVNYYLSR